MYSAARDRRADPTYRGAGRHRERELAPSSAWRGAPPPTALPSPTAWASPARRGAAPSPTSSASTCWPSRASSSPASSRSASSSSSAPTRAARRDPPVRRGIRRRLRVPDDGRRQRRAGEARPARVRRRLGRRRAARHARPRRHAHLHRNRLLRLHPVGAQRLRPNQIRFRVCY
jgi:hypothetical protein